MILGETTAELELKLKHGQMENSFVAAFADIVRPA